MSYPYNSGPQSVRHYSPNKNIPQNSNNAFQNHNQGYNYPVMDNQPVLDHINSVNNYSPPQYNYNPSPYFENNQRNFPEGQFIINPANQQNAPLIADIIHSPPPFKTLLNGVLILLFIDCLIALGGFMISLLIVLDVNGSSVLNFKILFMLVVGGELFAWMSAFLVAKQTETKPQKLLFGRILIIIANLLIITGYIIYFSKYAIIFISLYMETYIIVIKVIAAIVTNMMYIIYSRRRIEASQ